MANMSFSATIGDWCKKIPEAEEAVFKESCHELVEQLNQLLESMIYETPETPGYKRTKFLQASLMASKDAMPQLVRENPGAPVQPDFGDVLLVINDAELGDTIYLGYTANYGGYVHAGANGMMPRPWVTMVAQRWPQIVDEKAALVKARFGL